jgi:riboflavin kinase
MQKITFSGIVVSGKGEGSSFINLVWVRNQIHEKLSFEAYPGTLNLKIKQSKKIKSLFQKSQYIKIIPEKGFCEGIVIPAFINSQNCAIIIPKIKDYPENMIEIISPINLRDKLQVEDGDEITITFFI